MKILFFFCSFRAVGGSKLLGMGVSTICINDWKIVMAMAVGLVRVSVVGGIEGKP